MKGHLHLTCGMGGDGQPCLKQQSFRAPFHLSKPHVDAGALVVNVVNPTAGLFDGDELDLQVKVESGAHLVLTTPSASRIFRSRSGRAATVRQDFSVAEGAMMEFYPEPLIPHAGSVYDQQTRLQVEPGGMVVFFEWLTPGRVASGEVFQYAEIAWSTDVWHGVRLAVRERYRLSQDGPSLVPLRSVFPESHYLGCFVLGELDLPSAELENLASATCYLGWSPLVQGGWVIKALCADSLSTRQLMSEIRLLLHIAMHRNRPFLGRY